MKNFPIPQRADVSANNQAIFDQLTKAIGRVPNLYATFANSENGLANYLALSNAKTSLKAKEREVVNLVVSQVNDCLYCLSAHTVIAKINGFNDDQILEIRRAAITFDTKLDALAKLAKNIVETKGHVHDDILERFLSAGYTRESLVDTIILVGDKTITNYLYAATDIPVDWPEIPAL